MKTLPAANLPPHFKRPLRETPFHARARALSQVDSFIPWADTRLWTCSPPSSRNTFAIRNGHDTLRPDADGQVPDGGADASSYLNRL